MTSLIDVIFLLLLFFMLSSTFSKFGEIEIHTGQRGAAPFSDMPIVFARLEAQNLRINGRVAEADTIALMVDQHRRGGQIKLLLSVSDTATAQGLADAIRILKRVPNAEFAVLE